MLDLEPKAVWNYFEALSAIPRPSGHEEAVGEYLLQTAREHGMPASRDAVGNVVIRLPGTPGHEHAPVTILQGHVDMVCDKTADSKHDFLKDPILLRRVDGKVTATDTTLGADNGMGVALALALLDDPEVVHGPLELLFTVDEERGLTGAAGLKPGFLKGRQLLNLDTEGENEVFVGCAGGIDTVVTLRVAREPRPDRRPALRVAVGHLRGGHSGGDIHEGRGNANRILARLLQGLAAAEIPFALVSVTGGSFRNAIARDAAAVLQLDETSARKARAWAKKLQDTVRSELAGIDDGVTLSVTRARAEWPPLNARSRERLLTLLGAMPHGVLSMSREIPGLVETSTNFAIVTTRRGEVEICTSQRSSVESMRDWAAEWVSNIALLSGARVHHSDGYPGWKPNLESPLLQKVRQTFARIYGQEPEPRAIHAGLECGLIGARYPGMDMVSLGPTVRHAHTPQEEVDIASVERTYRALQELLRDLA